ncbi:MAG: magnesium transporter CorA family protein [bacterium]|nr:magnesium transporter CorA family protein [bacterium]
MINTIHTKNLRWIDLTNPGPKEISWLRQNYNFHELHFQAVAEHQQRPHLDEGNGYDFLVLLFPVYLRQTKEIIPGEVDFFIGNNFLITAHYGEINTLRTMFDQSKTSSTFRNLLMQQGPGHLLYKILESLFRRSYPILDHMSEDVTQIEKDIFKRLDNAMLYHIALMRRNIIEFRKMMKTHGYVLEKLPKRRPGYLTFAESKVYYRDLLEYSHNIWDILEALKETMDTFQDTNQTLATQRLNEITKFISLFSAIIIPATLVAFWFGVGVENKPFRHHPNGFWIVGILMILASLTTFLIFRRKKWF